MIKVFGSDRDRDVRYSPGKIISSEVIRISGDPDPKHVSTSLQSARIGPHEPTCAGILACRMDLAASSRITKLLLR
jgi:hypothetical protein